jgi:arylformamidase
LIRKKPKIVGIDYISIDSFAKVDLPVHNLLLSNNILIVEGLCLENAPIGRSQIFILPLKIPHMDGLPARVLCCL